MMSMDDGWSSVVVCWFAAFVSLVCDCKGFMRFMKRDDGTLVSSNSCM